MWKASLLDPATGKRAGFESVTALFRYLREILGITVNPEPSDWQSAPGGDHADSHVQGDEEGTT